MICDMMNGFSHRDMNYNIVDVRDVAEVQLRIAESDVVSNGDRYNLVCKDDSGMLSLPEIKMILQSHFPGVGIGTGIYFKADKWRESTRTGGSAFSVLEKCVTQLGIHPIPAAQSLIDTAESLAAMGLIVFREGEDNYQKDIIAPPRGAKGKTTGSLGIESYWLADGYPAGMNAPQYEEGAGQKELSERAKALEAKL